MDSKQCEKEVYALVDSLMKKIGIAYSIDYLLELYHEADVIPSPPISRMIEDICDESVKSKNEIAPNIPECAKMGYFPWDHVLASMYINPEKVKITEIVCPNCGEMLVELYFSSPAWTWRELCGRGGHMTICPNCPRQVEFKLEIMN